MSRRLAPLLFAPVLLAACGGSGGDGTGGSGSTGGDTAPRAALSMSSLCEDYLTSDAATQRAFAETAQNSEQTTADAVRFLNGACEGNSALEIAEAIGQAVAEEQESEDPYADTRIGGSLAAEIARSIRKSWNICGPSDVCISGETALSVGCRQPDPQVKKLSCFVTTERGEGGNDSGYSVEATVGEDSYSWRLDSG